MSEELAAASFDDKMIGQAIQEITFPIEVRCPSLPDIPPEV